MGYNQSLEKAWNEITNLCEKDKLFIKFLADEYEIDSKQRLILSSSCNVPIKEYISIIILHYLIQKLKLKTLPEPVGEWMEFRQLEGGDAYYPAFKKRVIDTLLRKFGSRPNGLLESTERLPTKRVQVGDIGVALEVFPQVPVLITIWKGDEEFGAEANILFDKNIPKIFCTEDIVVLTDLVVRLL